MSCNVLMYKGRLYSKRSDVHCTVKNAAHVEYIATRPGAWKDEESKNALFGSIDQQYMNSIEIKDGIKQITKATDNYKTVYRDIISFTSAQAAHLGLNTLDDWKKYVKEQVMVIAKERGIKLEDLEWEAAVHNKKGQPHAHIVMWDNSEATQPTDLDWKLNKKIRRKLIQKTYKAEFQEFFARQNQAKNTLRADSKELLKAFEEYLTPMKINSYDAAEYINGDIQFDVSGLSNLDILQTPNVEKILQEYLRVRMVVLKHKGSLDYEYLSDDRKNIVKSYINLLLNSNDKLRSLADQFVSSHIEVFKFYSANERELAYQTKKYSDEAIKMIANALLQSMKDYQFEDYTNGISDQDTMYIANSLFWIFCNLSKITQSNNARCAHYNALAKSGDLSKEAIKELIQERKDRGAEV